MSKTFAQGIRVGSWNTKPMLARPVANALVRVPEETRLKPRDEAQNRRFAAAGRAEQSEKFAFAHFEIKVREGDRSILGNLPRIAQGDKGRVTRAIIQHHWRGRSSRPTPWPMNRNV